MRHAVFSIALVAAATAQPARAQVITKAGVIIPQVAVMSDYRFDGMSNSARQPSVRASAYLWRPDGLYAGADLSRVEFKDHRSTDVELVAYAGKNLDRGSSRLTAEVMLISFPDQQGGAPGYGYVQGSLKARRTFGPVSVGGSATYTPNASYDGGPLWKFTGEGSLNLAHGLSLGARIGAYESLRRQDRLFFDVGAAASRGRATLEVRYTGTNLTREQCFYTDRCEPALVSRLTYTFTPTN